MDTEKPKNELLQKIGRNLVLFQQLEQLLKTLLTLSHIEIEPTGFTAQYQKRKEVLHKNTLGAVVQQYLNDVHASEKEEVTAKEDIKSIRIISHFSLQLLPDDLAHKEKTLQSLVVERNEFVHHLLPAIDFSSIGSMTALGDRLDAQRERVKTEIADAENILQTLIATWADLKDIFTTDAFITELQASMLSTSPVVMLLREIASESARKDGWTLLSHAGNILHKALPADMQSLKSKYGERNLKAIMIKSGNFELQDEPTSKGGSLSLYRNRINGNNSVH